MLRTGGRVYAPTVVWRGVGGFVCYCSGCDFCAAPGHESPLDPSDGVPDRRLGDAEPPPDDRRLEPFQEEPRDLTLPRGELLKSAVW